jgi:hypothetical protein
MRNIAPCRHRESQVKAGEFQLASIHRNLGPRCASYWQRQIVFDTEE